jgi:hypothetical protein
VKRVLILSRLTSLKNNYVVMNKKILIIKGLIIISTLSTNIFAQTGPPCWPPSPSCPQEPVPINSELYILLFVGLGLGVWMAKKKGNSPTKPINPDSDNIMLNKSQQ